MASLYNRIVSLLLEPGQIAKTRESPKSSQQQVDPNADTPWKAEICWGNVAVFVISHVLAVYGFYLAVAVAKWSSLLWAFALLLFCGVGITAGSHRLWCHRSYKAKWPLRLILAVAQTAAVQNDIHEWCRGHRIHHKYTDTNADPHNSHRGLFFAHVGWLLCSKHPELLRVEKAIDCSDLYNDPIVVFQRKYYAPLVLLCFAVSTLVPWYFWDESMGTSFFVCTAFRYIFSLNCTWLVNSAAHKWGDRPYDKRFLATENWFTSFFTAGEGWHNYHHAFPQDYRAAELGRDLAGTTAVIDFFAWLGWAYDLKSASNAMIRARIERTGHLDYKHAKTDKIQIFDD